VTISGNEELSAMLVFNERGAVRFIAGHLEAHGGKIRDTAKALGVARATFYRWCEDFPSLAAAVRTARYRALERAKVTRRFRKAMRR
jgi:DNA-binding NtrC family response regulator